VVFAAPVRELLELVSPELLPDSLVNFARNLESTSSIILEWITEEPIAQSGLILGMGVPFWAHFPTIEDPSLAPAGKHLSVFCWMMERGKGSDPEHQKESEKKLREHIENLFPKASEKVLDERKIIVPVQNGALLKPPTENRGNRHPGALFSRGYSKRRRSQWRYRLQLRATGGRKNKQRFISQIVKFGKMALRW